MKKIYLQIPASSANLGPGFDCLALALNLYNNFEATLRPDSFSIIHHGEGAEILKDQNQNLVIKSYQQTCLKHGWPLRYFKLVSHSDIPLESGLGSSATAIVAGIAIAYAFNGKELDRKLLLKDAYAAEQHPDNIAAAIFGGFTCAFCQGDNCYITKTVIPEKLKCLILKPAGKTNTIMSRATLPKNITMVDAVANLARATTMTASLINGDYHNLQEGMLDIIHEPYRINPEYHYPELKKKLIGEDFYGWSLSGSGPAVIIFCSNFSTRIKSIISEHFGFLKIPVDFFELTVDNVGLRYRI